MRRFLIQMFAFCVLTLPFVAWAQAPLTFIAISPCRLADTRTATGPFGGPSIAANTTRTIPVQSSTTCPIPGTAMAYSFNVTVIPQGKFLGYLTVYPASTTRPVVSNLNSFDGRFKAGAVIVGAGTGGAVDVYASDTTDVVVDVTGYFVAPGMNNGLQFYPMPNGPCNLVDTTQPAPKPDNGLYGPSMKGGETRSFTVTSQVAPCAIPPQAQAYSLNVTAIPSGPSLGYLTVWPQEVSKPLVSTLNAPTGTKTSNGALVLAGNGEVSVFAADATDVQIDINGYFAVPGIGGTSLYTETPCRALDTRDVNGQTAGKTFTGRLVADIQGSKCVPSPTAQAYVLNATVLPTAAFAYLDLLNPDLPGPAPFVGLLHALDAKLTSNVSIVGASTAFLPLGSIVAIASSPTQLVLDISGYFDSAALQWLFPTATNPLRPATFGVPYNATLSAQGGVPPYTWGLGSGTLPTGLTLDVNRGVISGWPTMLGVSSFTLTATDSSPTPVTVSQPASITVTVPCGCALAIQTQLLPPGRVGVPYNQIVLATGGVQPYTWSIISGSLPMGLTLSATTGALSGTPTLAGSFTFALQVTDSSGESAAQSFTIIIS